MNLFTPANEHPQLKEDFKRQQLAEIEREFEIDKFKIKTVTEFAHYSYPTTHKPTRDTIRQAIQFNNHFRRENNILIMGPSGTGKEVIAEIIAYDARAPLGGRLKSLNMAGLTDSLFESQLFGYVPGAFTGALSKGSKGFLQSVGPGIAFLDEIGELPLSQQAKILRVIQSREVMPVGAVEPIKIDCRFIFATNRDLLEMVRADTFREDLYFRISQLILRTYSLKERGAGEIRRIADHMCKFYDFTPLEADEYIPVEWVELGNVRAIYNLLLQRDVQDLKFPRYEPVQAS